MYFFWLKTNFLIYILFIYIFVNEEKKEILFLIDFFFLNREIGKNGMICGLLVNWLFIIGNCCLLFLLENRFFGIIPQIRFFWGFFLGFLGFLFFYSERENYFSLDF